MPSAWRNLKHPQFPKKNENFAKLNATQKKRNLKKNLSQNFAQMAKKKSKNKKSRVAKKTSKNELKIQKKNRSGQKNLIKTSNSVKIIEKNSNSQKVLVKNKKSYKNLKETQVQLGGIGKGLKYMISPNKTGSKRNSEGTEAKRYEINLVYSRPTPKTPVRKENFFEAGDTFGKAEISGRDKKGF